MSHLERIQELREKIDELDVAIVRAAQKRTRLARDLATLTGELALVGGAYGVLEGARESVATMKILAATDGPLDDTQVSYLLEAVRDLTTEDVR